MKNKLYEIMYDLEEIIRLIEDMRCSLDIQYMVQMKKKISGLREF